MQLSPETLGPDSQVQVQVLNLVLKGLLSRPNLPPLPTLPLTTVQQVPSVHPHRPAEASCSLAGCPLPPRQSYVGETVRARWSPRSRTLRLAPFMRLPSTPHLHDPSLGPRECGVPKRIQLATWLIPLVLLTAWASTYRAHLISNIQREHDSFFFNLVSWTIELGKQQVVYVK